MLKENTLAPDFTLNDQEGRTHSLSDYKGNWLLMYFYPMDFTPGCTIEACSIRNAFSDFDKYHIKVLGVNNGTEVSHKKFAEKFKLTFPLLSDTKMEVIKLYKANFFFLTRRISYLISPKGLIKRAYGFVNPSTHPKSVINDVEYFISSN